MSKAPKIIVIILSLVLILFVNLIEIKKNSSFLNLPSIRGTVYGDVPESKRGLVVFGEQIKHDIRFGPSEKQNTVKDFLDAGYSPNNCLTLYEGWNCSNPLMLFCTSSAYSTYYEENPTYPDVEVFNLLVNAGADVNKYPYVWSYVYNRDNFSINRFLKEYSENQITFDELNKKISCKISDYNRVIKLFLDAGSDVNRKGHPKPFDKEVDKRIKEKQVFEYFNSPEATTPLYEAIKKGKYWESQVDLLLEYGAILDESCLEAAKLSGDEQMMEKIQKLWEEKNK